MTTNTLTYQTILEQICTETIAPAASAVDRDGAFPEKSIEALKGAGLLGAMSGPEVGGSGLGVPGAAAIVGRVAQECGSTAMVLCMHYCGTAVLEAHAGETVRRAAASGEHLSTLAFSEAGSRSHFWAPVRYGTKRWRHRDPECRKELGDVRIPRHGLRLVVKAVAGWRDRARSGWCLPGRTGSRFKARSRASACAGTTPLPSTEKTFESLAKRCWAATVRVSTS